MSTWILIAWAVLGGMVVAFPLVLALVARRRLGVGWRYFAYGALIFVLFEIATHVWLNGGNWAPILQGRAGGSKALFIVLLFAWALSSGVCEEVGRYVGYRVFMSREEKTWSKAVMYGLGHGGIETILQNGLGLIVPAALGFAVGAPALLAAQVELKALNTPDCGCVTTTLSAGKIFPPPTGTSETFASDLPDNSVGGRGISATAVPPAPSAPGAGRRPVGMKPSCIPWLRSSRLDQCSMILPSAMR
jgi:hypothetical protein